MTIIISKDGKNSQKIDPSNFPNEDYLQKYIYENPDSIPISDIEDNAKLLIIAREFRTTSGVIDVLGIDQEGQIYIIETKLYKNPDKRKVVAQVLDYGASLWKTYENYQDFIDKIDEFTEANFESNFDITLMKSFGVDEIGVENIHQNISSNLKEGNYRFIVLMDKLHRDLKDLISFLNQNSKFDIYAMELSYYKHNDHEIMIPKLFGTEVKKSIAKYNRSGPKTEEYHFAKGNEKSQLLYEKIKNEISKFGDDVRIIPYTSYIAFKKNTNFIDIEFRKSKILVFYNMKKGTLHDHKNLVRDVSTIGHFGNGDYEFTIDNNELIDYAILLAHQSYDKN